MPTLRIDGDSRGAVKAHADLDAAVNKSKDAYKQAAKEAMDLEKAAKRIIQENLTPQERYNQQVMELAKAFNAGHISIDQQTRALNKYRGEMLQAGQAQKHAFGPEAIGEVVKFGIELLGVGSAPGGCQIEFRSGSRCA